LLLCSSYLPLGVPNWVPNTHYQIRRLVATPWLRRGQEYSVLSGVGVGAGAVSGPSSPVELGLWVQGSCWLGGLEGGPIGVWRTRGGGGSGRVGWRGATGGGRWRLGQRRCADRRAGKEIFEGDE
jgi:hypothetical protein